MGKRKQYRRSGAWIQEGLHNISEGLGWIADKAATMLGGLTGQILLVLTILIIF